MIYDKVPISMAEVPMPELNYDGYDLIDRFLRNNLDDDDYAEYMSGLQQYGDAREAAGYARGLVEAEETRRLYNELLYQVETKNPGETRHETALVYIRRTEKYHRNQNAQEVKPVDKP